MRGGWLATIRPLLILSSLVGSLSTPTGLTAEERLLPAGPFIMGDTSACEEGLADERPAHQAQVSPFFIEQYEVSAALWQQVRQWGLNHGYGDLPEGHAGSGANGDSRLPTTGVSWYDSLKWCNARSEMEGLAPVYYADTLKTIVYREGQEDLPTACVRWEAGGYRLPTEAEWEYAARGALEAQYYPWPGSDGTYGDHVNGGRANYRKSGDPLDDGTTCPGYYDGTQQPPGRPGNNGFWLYDMAGNVSEWCWDAYAPDDYAARAGEGLAVDPHGPDNPLPGGCRVARGGSWDSGPFDLRCSFRDPASPGQRDTRTGLRCVRSCAMSNQAIVSTFGLFVEQGLTMVRWTTAAEPGTVGFRLYRLEGTVPVPVTTDLVCAAGASHGGIGAGYSYVDPLGPSSAVYQLVETRSGGETVRHGPFECVAYRFELLCPTSVVPGVVQIRWRSRSNEWYSVWRSADVNCGFVPLKKWIAPTPPENVFLDEAINGISVFYRVGSEP